MRIIFHWLMSTAAILIAAYLLSGVHVENVWVALVLAIVLGAINAFVKPILFVLTFPVTVVTLGIFALFLNALMVELAAYFVRGFSVDNIWWALLFSLVLSVINAVFHRMNKE